MFKEIAISEPSEKQLQYYEFTAKFRTKQFAYSDN